MVIFSICYCVLMISVLVLFVLRQHWICLVLITDHQTDQTDRENVERKESHKHEQREISGNDELVRSI